MPDLKERVVKGPRLERFWLQGGKGPWCRGEDVAKLEEALDAALAGVVELTQSNDQHLRIIRMQKVAVDRSNDLLRALRKPKAQ